MLPILVAIALSVGPAFARKPPVPPLLLAESVPVDSGLDDPVIPDAQETWIDLIRGARDTLDIAQFYVSTAADSEEPAVGEDRLEPVLKAIEKAARKGVQVRFLADAKFAETYPAQLERLEAARGIEVRRYDMDKLTGGVLHAKYFIVDGQRAWLGSQNFDWRSLQHILELGVRIDEPEAAAAFTATFELDWALAGGEDKPTAVDIDGHFPVELPYTSGHGQESTVQLTPVMSPAGLLPDPDLWDLPRIEAMLEGAEERVRVQLLSYSVKEYRGEYWDRLDRGLRAAAYRGVDVQLIVADWSKKKYKVEALQSLATVPHVHVRFIVVPDHPDGFVPFGRVVHSKFLVVDGQRSWVGTSNWGEDYFLSSRNVGVVVEGAAFAADLDERFDLTWSSEYAEPVDPCAKYEPRRVK